MMTVDLVMQTIDRATEPRVMPKKQALEFLEEVETELQSRMEALREEIADEEKTRS